MYFQEILKKIRQLAFCTRIPSGNSQLELSSDCPT